jgi:hypothetical protein
LLQNNGGKLLRMRIEDNSRNLIMHLSNFIMESAIGLTAEYRKEKMVLKRSRLNIFSSLVLLIIFSLLIGGLATSVLRTRSRGGLLAADTGKLAFDKELVSWVVGNEPGDLKFDLKVNITDVTDLKGIVFSVEWDPTYLEVPSYTSGDFLPLGMPDATGWMISWDEPGGKMKEAANQFMPGHGPASVSKPSWGWVMTLVFEFVGTPPTAGSSIDTEIRIVKDPEVGMETKWRDSGNVYHDFDKLSDPYVHVCHFHYEAEVALATVHLESEEDTAASTNLGSITFDGVSYPTLPDDAVKAPGTYQAQYFADAGYVFDHWETTGAASVSDADANPVQVTVSGDGTLKAIYSVVTVTYTVHLESEEDTAASTNLGSITFDGVSYPTLPDDAVKAPGTYQAQYFADAGYVFDHWETICTGLSLSDENANSVQVTVSGDGTLKAIYRRAQNYTLTITSTLGGTTDPVPGSYSYYEGTVVSVTAIPDSTYIFDYWELDGVDVGSDNPISVTITANHTLHAVFKPVAYHTLTITSTTGGTTNPSPGAYSYEKGTVVSVKANPDAGYVFAGWVMDFGYEVANPILVQMNQNHTLHAVFEEVTPPPPVGGRAGPIDKSQLLTPKIDLTPRIGLGSILLGAIAATVILIRRKKRH